MDLRIFACTFVLVISTSAAMAQRELPRRFPAEKFSAQPVQPVMTEEPARLSTAANPERLPVTQSRWAKFCGKDKNNPHGKPVCLTVKEVRLRSHDEPFLAGVALIEASGEDKKILRATLPTGLQRSTPVRIHIDDHPARSGEFRQCRSNGCMWDFLADATLVALLKTGGRLHIEGVTASGEVASYRLPLTEFARANEGPPIDPAVFEQEEKRRWEERSHGPSELPR